LILSGLEIADVGSKGELEADDIAENPYNFR